MIGYLVSPNEVRLLHRDRADTCSCYGSTWRPVPCVLVDAMSDQDAIEDLVCALITKDTELQRDAESRLRQSITRDLFDDRAADE